MASNRRRHQRVKPKQLTGRVQGGDALHIGLMVENISVGGAFVRCASPMKVGTRVTLELHRSGASTPIPVAGVVTSTVTPAEAAERKTTPGMGIAFDAMQPHIEVRIEGIIGAADPSALRANLEEGPTARIQGSRSPTYNSQAQVPALRPPSKSGLEVARPAGKSGAEPAHRPSKSQLELPPVLAPRPTREGVIVRAPTPSRELKAVQRVGGMGLSPELSAELTKVLRQVAELGDDLAAREREIDELKAENERLRQQLRTRR